ncbi:MAG: hypothetical protein R6W90_16050 [Ignavibacteriaceae bacterium]
MKKLFTNYNFEFNKNEKKLIATFCKQALKQIEGDNRYFQEERALRSVIDKINSGEDTIKLTRDERTRLKFQMENNVKYIKQKIGKSWFIKKWLLKSMLTQYESILDEHFKG